MRQSTRLILNTGATYVRMAVTVGMGLFATRLAVQELGKANFDLWALVTSAVLFLVFLAEACSGSAERSMAIAIGANDPVALRRAFTNGTAMQFAVAAGFLIVGIIVARVVLEFVGVPEVELHRARTAFALVVGSISLWIASQTFKSMFVAHQSLVWLTLADLAEATLRFGAIVATMFLPGDRLVTYCLMLLVAQAGVTLLLVALCWRCYRDSWLRLGDIDRATVRGLFNFSAWAVLGNLSYRIRSQGPSMVLGRTFGTAYNGAFSLAQQLASYQTSLAAAIQRAATPAINAAHGRGDRTTVEHLAHLVNKYGVLLALFYVIPIAIEAPTLLVVWLKDPPPAMSATFVRFAMIALCIPWLTMGHHLAVFGHGGIRRYMVLSLAFELAALGLGAVAVIWGGLPAWSVLAYTVVGQCWIGCLVLHAAWRSQGIRFRAWLVHSVGPVVLVAGPGAAAALAVNALMSPGFSRVVAVGVVYAMVAMPLVWGVGMRGYEREHFLRLGRGVGGKITSVVKKRRGGDQGPGGGPPSPGPVAPPSREPDAREGTVDPCDHSRSPAPLSAAGAR